MTGSTSQIGISFKNTTWWQMPQTFAHYFSRISNKTSAPRTETLVAFTGIRKPPHSNKEKIAPTRWSSTWPAPVYYRFFRFGIDIRFWSCKSLQLCAAILLRFVTQVSADRTGMAASRVIVTAAACVMLLSRSHAPGMLRAKGCSGSRPQRLKIENLFHSKKDPNQLNRLSHKD